MPAAAVIPAPIAYVKVVAVKKLVVGFLIGGYRGLLELHSRILWSYAISSMPGIHLSGMDYGALL